MLKKIVKFEYFLSLILLVSLSFSTARADEVYTKTEIRCDEQMAEFEMANYTIHDGRRVTYIERRWENPLKNAMDLSTGKTMCSLNTEPPISIEISGNTTRGNIQGMCGAMSGSQQFIIKINNQNVAWPSDYYRCFGSLPAPQMQDFENQMHWPSYIKINSKSVTMYNHKRYQKGVTDFYYALTEHFLETDETP